MLILLGYIQIKQTLSPPPNSKKKTLKSIFEIGRAIFWRVFERI